MCLCLVTIRTKVCAVTQQGTMDSPQPVPEKAKMGLSGNQILVTICLRCLRYNPHRFSLEGIKNQGRISFKLIGPVQRRFGGKTPTFDTQESDLPPRQCEGALVRNCNEEI